MQYRVHIEGVSPIIMHNGQANLDPYSPANIEKAAIAKKRGTNRTESDDKRLRALECLTSLYLRDGLPTVPEAMIRANIESGARKLKQGPQVREGLIVTEVVSFDYDAERYGTTVEELVASTQFVTGVVVQRSRILRTRAKFDEWAVTFIVEADDELVDQSQLEAWLDIGGRRIGIGDWRPEKSGHYGRYKTVAVTPLAE